MEQHHNLLVITAINTLFKTRNQFDRVEPLLEGIHRVLLSLKRFRFFDFGSSLRRKNRQKVPNNLREIIFKLHHERNESTEHVISRPESLEIVIRSTSGASSWLSRNMSEKLCKKNQTIAKCLLQPHKSSGTRSNKQ